jgi:predicted TIM-barrel fold metal-dependent hydrolase
MIDAHQHFWRVARGDYGWLTPALGPIYRDFMPDNLAPMLARHGITGTILVQAAPTVAETRFMLDIARTTPFVKGVVGWTEFEAAYAPAAIAELATDPLLVGLRPMVQDIADDDWLLRPVLQPALDTMVAHGLVFDALVLPRHLPPLKNIHRTVSKAFRRGGSWRKAADPRPRDGAMGHRHRGYRGVSACDVQAVGTRHGGCAGLAGVRHRPLCGAYS